MFVTSNPLQMDFYHEIRKSMQTSEFENGFDPILFCHLINRNNAGVPN